MTCGQMSVCACKNPVFILNMVKWIGTTHKNQSSQLLEKKKKMLIFLQQRRFSSGCGHFSCLFSHPAPSQIGSDRGRLVKLLLLLRALGGPCWRSLSIAWPWKEVWVLPGRPLRSRGW